MNAIPPTGRRAVIATVIARCPDNAAGNTWAFMNWALGFRSLGWDVWIVEAVGAEDLAFPEGQAGPDPSRSKQGRHWREAVARFGFEGRATLFVDGDAPERERFREFAAGADVFVNLSGQFKLFDLLGANCPRVYVDLDPAFSQIWAAAHGCDMNWDAHGHFFSVGTTLATARVPDTGRDWLPVVPPVSLDHWPEMPPPAAAPQAPPWTTVTYWYGFSELAWEGVRMGIKRDSFLELIDLPGRAGARFLVATDLCEAWDDYAPFRAAGWEFCPPARAGATVDSYREFIASSRGEIGVAKHGYAVSRSGWLSDRTVCYLASGRPAVLQDTGWTSWLPPRDGMLAFSCAESAAAAIREVESDYPRHARAARRAAEEIFDARRVIPDFLRRVGVG